MEGELSMEMSLDDKKRCNLLRNAISQLKAWRDRTDTKIEQYEAERNEILKKYAEDKE